MKNLINIKGALMDLSVPKVMGIVNITPDSFFEGSRCQDEKSILGKCQLHISQGADILDIGAYSTRPGCKEVSQEEESSRIKFALSIIRKEFPNIPISVDTFRSSVAQISYDFGADIINDISGFDFDEKMLETIANINLPYILMHHKGGFEELTKAFEYKDIVSEMILYFSQKIDQLKLSGVKDIIVDLGFGFAKSLDDNYVVLNNLEKFKIFSLPILVGVSRKSMMKNLLNISSEEALNATSVINTISVLKGANILRVHDVKQAVEVVKLCQKTMQSI